MPKNCCVPLCASNAKKNPGLSYHEFPSSAERRQAWLTNISRQGSGGKETRWVPSDRSSVCSLHFTENDYKKGTKLRMLLPTAIPTVFPNYPSYMQKPRAPRIRKWPRREVPDGGSSACAKKSARNGPDESRHEDVEPISSEIKNMLHQAGLRTERGTVHCLLIVCAKPVNVQIKCLKQTLTLSG